MLKNKIIIGVVLVIIGCGLAYYFYFNSGKNKDITEMIPVKTSTNAYINERAEENLQAEMADIVRLRDFNNCKNITDETYRKACINNIALELVQEKKDKSFCENIDGKLIQKSDCEKLVVLPEAIEKNNPSVCESITDELVQQECKDSVYLQLAKINSDQKYCEQIKEREFKDICHDAVLINASLQNKFENFQCDSLKIKEAKDDCLKAIDEFKNINFVCEGAKSSLWLTVCSNIVLNNK